MKKLSLLTFIFSLSVAACPEIQGKFEMNGCSGNEPSTVLSIPMLGSISFERKSVIEIEKISGCDMTVKMGGKSIDLREVNNREWNLPYPQSRNEERFIIKNKSLVFESKPAYRNIFADRNNAKVTITQNTDQDLVISRKAKNVWFLGMYPVIDRWSQSCTFKKVD